MTPPMTLLTKFEVDPPPLVVKAMRQELTSVMAPVGLHFEWRSLSRLNGYEQAVSLAVITFKGQCTVKHIPMRLQNYLSLGLTHVSDGLILPFSDIDCDQIRSFVREELLAEKSERREAVFGRAIGRVLAHELYHILGNTRKHGLTGIGKATLGPHELISGVFEFDSVELTAMRTGEIVSFLTNPNNVLVRAPAGDQSGGSDHRREAVAGEGSVVRPDMFEK